jgi:hypothetical protein
MKPSFKTTLIMIQLVAIIALSAWLYSDYVSNPFMRQYIASFLQGTQEGQILQQLAGVGTIFVLPLRLLALFLLSVVSTILMLLLLFMFATFFVSVLTGRGRTKKSDKASAYINGQFTSLVLRFRNSWIWRHQS